MGIRFPVRILGVEIIFIRGEVARKVTNIVPCNRGVWALLPDGRVGYSDASFFKWAVIEGSDSYVRAAEFLWRLGKLPKAQYLKLSKAREAKKAAQNRRSDAADLKSIAKRIGFELTKDQKRSLDKAA